MTFIIGGLGLFFLIISLLMSVTKFPGRSEEWVYHRAVVYTLQAIALLVLALVTK